MSHLDYLDLQAIDTEHGTVGVGIGVTTTGGAAGLRMATMPRIAATPMAPATAARFFVILAASTNHSTRRPQIGRAHV